MISSYTYLLVYGFYRHLSSFYGFIGVRGDGEIWHRKYTSNTPVKIACLLLPYSFRGFLDFILIFIQPYDVKLCYGYMLRVGGASPFSFRTGLPGWLGD